MQGEDTLLRMRGIAKRYGSVAALQGVDFTLRRGEVMALLGENGAGKSTLVKILAGLERPDAGTIEIGGEIVTLRSPGQSLRAGVAYVTQELSIISSLSIAENICLGGGDDHFVWTQARLAAKVRPFLALVGLGDIDPGLAAGSLSLAQQQLVEIARLLSRDARILILDEPTAALSDAEIEKVKAVVRKLAAEGRSVIYVTHRLGEVFEIGDRVTIFRNGRSFDPAPVKDLDIDELIEHLLGRRLDQMFPPRGAGIGPVAMSVRDVIAPGLAEPVSFDLRRGEILGLAGQLGSGANAIVKAIAGAEPRRGGTISLGGRPLTLHSVRDAIANGIAYCSDDRKRDGIFGVRKVIENLTAPSLRRISSGGLLSGRRENELATQLAGFFEIAVGRLGSQAGKLSGGNQQKVALGKWLGIEPSILLVEEPTRGVDVGARAEIYHHLRTLAERGLGIAFASSDNQEVLGLADTVATFFRGRLVRMAAAETLDPEELLRDVTHPASTEAGGAR
ncbi:MAG: sugar ABC transporter ATP-binding protein [Methylobacteriaceae bacterium]|nr:sugar ABC transporter ATP-binding protein [Methylobacteriaceae bacterium]